MWVGISAVGVFHTADGGATWEARNRGVRAVGQPDEYPETGQCVHKFGLHPDRPEVLYQQNHSGAYRSDDGGLTWQDINAGLPSHFGFGLAIHPHDPRTIWTTPLNGDDQGRFMPDGHAAVWMSRDEGATWAPQTEGLPHEAAYLGVLREAMATDRHDPAGVYVGTSTGQLFGSRDEGRSWRLLADFLPGDLLGRGDRARQLSSSVAHVQLPRSLVALFPGVPRRLEVPAHDLADLILELDARYPGMWDRLCEPGPRLRLHINAFVDGQPATLESSVTADSVVHIIPAVSGGAGRAYDQRITAPAAATVQPTTT